MCAWVKSQQVTWSRDPVVMISNKYLDNAFFLWEFGAQNLWNFLTFSDKKVILEKSKFWSASRVRDLEKENFHFFFGIFKKCFLGIFIENKHVEMLKRGRARSGWLEWGHLGSNFGSKGHLRSFFLFWPSVSSTWMATASFHAG